MTTDLGDLATKEVDTIKLKPAEEFDLLQEILTSKKRNLLVYRLKVRMTERHQTEAELTFTDEVIKSTKAKLNSDIQLTCEDIETIRERMGEVYAEMTDKERKDRKIDEEIKE